MSLSPRRLVLCHAPGLCSTLNWLSSFPFLYPPLVPSHNLLSRSPLLFASLRNECAPRLHAQRVLTSRFSALPWSSSCSLAGSPPLAPSSTSEITLYNWHDQPCNPLQFSTLLRLHQPGSAWSCQLSNTVMLCAVPPLLSVFLAFPMFRGVIGGAVCCLSW